jgi:LmbE family N-acetylglucosaminyl deacetylase
MERSPGDAADPVRQAVSLRPLGFKRVLVLAPHTDDEFGCAGSICRIAEEGAEIFYAAFSTCAESVPAGFPKDVLAKEVMKSTEALGIPKENVVLFDFRVRYFTSARQDILEELVRLRKKWAPDLVFAPASSDIHQDHNVVANESGRAFKSATILGYELPWNCLRFQHSCFLQITPQHLERKLQAMACYASQGFRSYADPQFIRSLARVRGVQAGFQFAETFEVPRLIL